MKLNFPGPLITFYWNTITHILYCLGLLSRRNIRNEPKNPTIFTALPFTEKYAEPCLSKWLTLGRLKTSKQKLEAQYYDHEVFLFARIQDVLEG